MCDRVMPPAVDAGDDVEEAAAGEGVREMLAPLCDTEPAMGSGGVGEGRRRRAEGTRANGEDVEVGIDVVGVAVVAVDGVKAAAADGCGC